MGGSGGGQGGPRFGNTAQAANPQIADPMQNLNNSGAPNFPRQGGMRPPPPRTNSGEGRPGFRPIPPQGNPGSPPPTGGLKPKPMPPQPRPAPPGMSQEQWDQMQRNRQMENQIRTNRAQLGRMGTPLPVSGGGGTQINAPEQKPQIGPDGNAYMIIGGNRVDLGPPGSQKYNSFFEPIQQIDNLRPYRPIGGMPPASGRFNIDPGSLKGPAFNPGDDPYGNASGYAASLGIDTSSTPAQGGVDWKAELAKKNPGYWDEYNRRKQDTLPGYQGSRGGMPPTGGGSIDMQQPERERQQRIQQLMSSLQGGGAGGK